MKPLPGILLLFLALALPLTAQEFVALEVPWGQGVRLADFGGPDLEVGVRAREMTHVVAEITDYTRLVPIARANVQGFVAGPGGNPVVVANPDAKMVPLKITTRVEKKNGRPYEGGRYEMYLLFDEPASGISVYFLDSIARQNHDNVVVVLPKRSPRGKAGVAPGSAPELIPELAEWYDRLIQERRTLDVTNAKAVEDFNRHAADYHLALDKVRAAREALKLAPGQSAR